MNIDILMAIILIPILSGVSAYFAIYLINKKNANTKPDNDLKENQNQLKNDNNNNKNFNQNNFQRNQNRHGPSRTFVDEKVIDETKIKVTQMILEAKEESIKIKQRAESEISEERKKIIELDKKIDRRQSEISNNEKKLQKEFEQLNETKANIEKKLKEAEDLQNEQNEKLEKIAALTKDEAKNMLLGNLEKTLGNDMARKIKEAEERFQLEADAKGKEILVDAMHTASTDYVAEYTISKIKLADPDLKGKIIGKDGRNIKAFEDATGVNVDFDDAEIRLSSFDSVRREIARISLERLIKDGRIHPARIEEVISKTTFEMDKVILQAGEDLCASVGVYNLPKELLGKLGAFKYRTSYGQNMIIHTLEETKIGVRIAKEIGADIVTTKLACLLHDIGKVITDKEGNHIELGAEYLKRFNLPEGVITAVAEHHNDKPSTIPGIIVQIADSISGSRPGARYEDYDSYVKRMRALEEAATKFDGVEKAFAISAGRELRVIVKPEDINDVQAVKLSHDIAEKIQKEQTYPGTVKVIVIREMRTVSTAT